MMLKSNVVLLYLFEFGCNTILKALSILESTKKLVSQIKSVLRIKLQPKSKKHKDTALDIEPRYLMQKESFN